MKGRTVLSVMLALGMAGMLWGCAQAPKTGAENEAAGGLLKENGRFIDLDTVSLPPGGSRTRDEEHVKSREYDDTAAGALGGYIAELKEDGYQAEETAYEYLLTKDNILIFITDNTASCGQFSLTCREGVPPPAGGLSAADALDIIGGGDILGLIETGVPDLYDRTGAQVFIAAYRRQFDSENERFETVKYIVTPDAAFALPDGYDALACADIDADGGYELVYLTLGPTSGLFTFGVGVYGIDGQGIREEYASVFFPDSFGSFGLKTEPGGAVKLTASGSGVSGTAEFAVSVKDGRITISDENGPVFRDYGFAP